MKNHHDWLEFLQGQMVFSFFCGTLFCLVMFGAELLHFVSGGRTPSLIERLDKWQPSPKHPINLDDHDDETMDDEEEEEDAQYWNP